MIRPLAVFVVLAFGLGAATAQEAAPAPAETAPEIVVDPAATINNSSKQTNMLTGFYATQAVIEICAVTLEPGVAAGMATDRLRLETALGLDPARAAEAYSKTKADVETTSPDCAEGSADRAGVDAVTAIYQSTAAAAETPAVSPAPATTTAQ